MIESFLAIKTAVHAFTGGGAKLANKFGMVTVAARALHGFLLKHFGSAELLLGVGRRNAKSF